ncbi:D-alanyl-D-alanine endopeptidase [Motilimonas cestriensis]|uniref:D-alanyl-D-alanine endopeptidase n=1 Tax=Motilimonas cestriensis TaxID=2742685 RepID=A0ABS8WDD3_9GAMM|nr:D-alanyl-D-alanine endopeptidase [Motilimonas cestriensis]
MFSFSAHAAPNPNKLQLASVSAYVSDYKTGKTIAAKNADTLMPIASITKLMTAMVILDSGQSLKEKITFTKDHRALIEYGHSRIRTGSQISRGEAIRLALMSSENLAAAALGATYPGGYTAFVKAMNTKAKLLGMERSQFVEATGLSPLNQSTARDLSRLVTAAYNYPLIRKYSTTATHTANFSKPRYVLGYTNTNVLVRGNKWQVSLSKTGYLNEAGRCLVMVTKLKGKQMVVVMLNSYGKRTPVGDAARIKKWLETGNSGNISNSAKQYQRQQLAQLLAD